jgi:hypothetical protein
MDWTKHFVQNDLFTGKLARRCSLDFTKDRKYVRLANVVQFLVPTSRSHNSGIHTLLTADKWERLVDGRNAVQLLSVERLLEMGSNICMHMKLCKRNHADPSFMSAFKNSGRALELLLLEAKRNPLPPFFTLDAESLEGLEKRASSETADGPLEEFDWFDALDDNHTKAHEMDGEGEHDRNDRGDDVLKSKDDDDVQEKESEWEDVYPGRDDAADDSSDEETESDHEWHVNPGDEDGSHGFAGDRGQTGDVGGGTTDRSLLPVLSNVGTCTLVLPASRALSDEEWLKVTQWRESGAVCSRKTALACTKLLQNTMSKHNDRLYALEEARVVSECEDRAARLVIDRDERVSRLSVKRKRQTAEIALLELERVERTEALRIRAEKHAWDRKEREP